MDEDLIRRWNRIVSPNDIVYNLGDVSFNPQRYVCKLNGRMILIQGNHDKRKYNGLFQEVHKWISLRIGKFKCLLNHKPICISDPFDKRQWKPSSNLMSAFEQHEFVICGHVHKKWAVNGKNINVGVDIWGMTPVSQNRIIAYMTAMRRGDRFVPESPDVKTQRLLEILEADKWQNPRSHPAWAQILESGKQAIELLKTAATDVDRWIPALVLKEIQKNTIG